MQRHSSVPKQQTSFSITPSKPVTNMAACCRDNGKHQLHVLFLPFFATGHIIPLVNAARLFASRGVKATILTTHHNASLFQSSIIDNDNIYVHNLMFPFAEVGLPEGIENFSTAPSHEMTAKIFYAIFLLQKPMEETIRGLRPDCIFSDIFFPWTVDIAQELNIPRIMFNQSSFMHNCILHNIKLHKPHQRLLQESQMSSTSNFIVPGLPDEIEFKLSQLTEDLRKPADERTRFDELLDEVRDSEDRSYGIVQDTFYELEPAYADYYQKLKKKAKYWHIGPISHYSSKIQRNELVIGNDNCDSSTRKIVEWLNEQKLKSVLYISFGSICRFPEGQLVEIARALESSAVPFIWVVRKDQYQENDFEEKNKQGLIIRGWAPQLTILDHLAIGGFMTHCGWNSVLEAITAGVPMLTWPIFAEQFYNEKLVEVMGLGVKMGAEICNLEGTNIKSPVLGSEKINKAIERLMMSPGSEESLKIRDKAMVMSEMAKFAIQEGGSSCNSLTKLIEDIKNFKNSPSTTTMA